jgi:hypothetical protein
LLHPMISLSEFDQVNPRSEKSLVSNERFSIW